MQLINYKEISHHQEWNMELNGLNSDLLKQDLNNVENPAQAELNKSPLESLKENLQNEDQLNQQKFGIEAFKQSVENDPVAQLVSFLI